MNLRMFRGDKLPACRINKQKWQAGSLPDDLALARFLCVRWQHDSQVLMGTRNHLHADDLSDPPSSRGAGVGRAFDGGHVASDECRHESAANLVPADKLDVGSFEH